MYLVLFCSTCSIQLDIQSDRVFSIHVTPNMSNLLFLDTVGSIFHLLLKLSLKLALLACSLCSISLRNLSILSIFSSCILIVFVKKSSCFLYNCMQIILSFSKSKYFTPSFEVELETGSSSVSNTNACLVHAFVPYSSWLSIEIMEKINNPWWKGIENVLPAVAWKDNPCGYSNHSPRQGHE